jgi:CBS domain-containing protein
VSEVGLRLALPWNYRSGRYAGGQGWSGRPEGGIGVSQTVQNGATVYTLDVTDTRELTKTPQPTEPLVTGRVPFMTDEPLSVLTRREPLSVPPGTSLAECVRVIQRGGVGDSVFVCDSADRLVGVLAERDVFARLVTGQEDLTRPVDSLLNTEPKTLRLDQTILDAIDLMQTGRYRNIPLVDDAGHLVGVVRQNDIIRYLAESFPEELLNLPPRPHQSMKEPEGA